MFLDAPGFSPSMFLPGNVWKSPSQFYPAGFIRINPPGKSQKNPHEGGFFQKTAKNWLKMVTFV